MEAAQQPGDDVGVLRMEVVAGAIVVGRHKAALIAAVLAIVALAQLDAGDLGDGVGLVGRLQGAGSHGATRNCHHPRHHRRFDQPPGADHHPGRAAGVPQLGRLPGPIGPPVQAPARLARQQGLHRPAEQDDGLRLRARRRRARGIGLLQARHQGAGHFGQRGEEKHRQPAHGQQPCRAPPTGCRQQDQPGARQQQAQGQGHEQGGDQALQVEAIHRALGNP